MMNPKRIRENIGFLLLAAAVMFLASCGSNNDKDWDGSGVDGTHDGTGPDGTDGTVTTDGTDSTNPDLPPLPKGSIEGVVYSPESGDPAVANFPVSGALLYLTQVPPADIQEGVVCEKCVTISDTVPHTFSSADGSFRIDNVTEGTWILVVQKGKFRRLSYIEVVADMVTTIDVSQTTFPRYNNPPNETTPRMAVALGSYDIMEDIVAKMGLCPLDTEYHWSEEPCDHIDMFYNGDLFPRREGTYTPFTNLLQNLDWMLEYDVIFVPCSDSTSDSALYDDNVLNNIREYVNRGGKWYIADWSYDFVEQAFQDFIDFEGDDFDIGAADDASTDFDSMGRAVDTELRDWLMAISEPADGINFEENWDCIVALGNVPGFDEDGNPITITPYTWAEGPIDRYHDCMSGNAPLTITFPYGCGKVLFTTYHTVGAMGGEGRPTLLTQEKILFYLILEIGLCTEGVVII